MSTKDKINKEVVDTPDIASIISAKLTVEELSILCDYYDNGTLDDIFDTVLIPKDFKNHPEKYTTKICRVNDDDAE